MQRLRVCLVAAAMLIATSTFASGATGDESFWRDHGAAVLAVSFVAALAVAAAFVAAVRRVRRRAGREIAAHERAVPDRPSSDRRLLLAADALASLAGHVAVLDHDGTILAVNEAWNAYGRAKGVSDASAIGPGVNYLDVCARAARAGVRQAAEAFEGIDAVCHGRCADFELEYRSDGPIESEWFLMKVTPLRNGRDGAVVSHRNMTAWKRQEIAARERALPMLVDTLPVAVKILDRDGVGRHFNTTWLRMTGHPLDEELGRHWMEHVHRDDRAGCERAYEQAVATRKPVNVEYRVRHADGRFRWLLDRTSPRYDEDGEFDGLVCASIDISDRRLAEARLRELTRRLVSAQEDERRHIARELHDDLNQRLALLAIEIEQMSLQMADDEPLSSWLRGLWRQTTEISREVHNLSHALHSSTLETLGLVPAIRTLCRELSAKGLHVAFTAEERCSNVSRDTALVLFRIVQEALTNVLKHSGVRDAVVTMKAAEDIVTVRVEDAGCGFDVQTQPPGLGLVSMRERLVAIGGELTIQSQEGTGTAVEARVRMIAAQSAPVVPRVAGAA